MSDENPPPLCHYCGINTAGSPEHLPGVASLNDTPVTYKFLQTTPGGLREVVQREDDGFMVYTICESCNTRTGGDYGAAFSKFAHQFAASGTFSAPGHRRVWVALENIQPLRVLKQMAAMVLAAQAIVPNASLAPLQRFVRQKRHPLNQGAGAFYLYRNVSDCGRIASINGSKGERLKRTQACIEVGCFSKGSFLRTLTSEQ